MVALDVENDYIRIFYNATHIGNVRVVETPQTLEPHVEWNESATNRGIYEGFIAVISRLRAIKQVIIIANQKFCKFFDGFVKRQVLRKVGIILDIFIENEMLDLHIYQAVK